MLNFCHHLGHRQPPQDALCIRLGFFSSSANCQAASCRRRLCGRLGTPSCCSSSIWPSRWIWWTKQGGGDYFHAAAELSKISDENGGCNPYSSNPCTVPTVPPIQYFEDVFPQLKDYDYTGESATQAIYNNEWAPYRYDYGETTSLADLDFYCYSGWPERHPVLAEPVLLALCLVFHRHQLLQRVAIHTASSLRATGLPPTSATPFPNPSTWGRERSAPTSFPTTRSEAPEQSRTPGIPS